MIIIDNFYNNAQQVRDVALSTPFDVVGNFPGRRTKASLNDETKQELQRILHIMNCGQVTNWQDQYTGAFQITTCSDRSWIHSDHSTVWAGVIYLTPNAPLSGGTGFYRHSEHGVRSTSEAGNDEKILHQLEQDGNDVTKWELTDRISNIYNRLILYRADLFHTSMDYFGSNLHNGRLFQTFFLDTEH